VSVVRLESAGLVVEVNPDVGGTITRVHHKSLAKDVLGSVPWQAIDAPLDSLAARDEREWLTRYTGGWPLLFPNGGDPCDFGGAFHGFHGEASIAPWAFAADTTSITLRRRFVTVAAEMERVITLDGESVHVSETVHYTGDVPAEVMWGHHPSFSRDLLEGPFEITTGAARVTADASYDPPLNPLKPGASGRWPVVPGKAGDIDVSRLRSPVAALAYLDQFADAWTAIRRLDDSVAAVLSWDGVLFPCAWLWFELEGTSDQPWNGRTRLIGIEPNTTRQATGLLDAKRRGASLLRLSPGQRIVTALKLTVFRPSGPLLQLPSGMGINSFTTSADFPP
jgi:hypothetical protein